MNRLAQLNQLGPSRIIQVHLFQELVGYSLQCVLGPNLLTEQHEIHDENLSVRVLKHEQHCKVTTPDTRLVCINIESNNLCHALGHLFVGLMVMTNEEESA